MKKIVISMFILLGMWGCNAQEGEQVSVKEPEKSADKSKPKVSWKVNKETDEYGNVIRYDSIYSWSYSTDDGLSKTVDIDSLMRQFDGFMSERMPDMWNDRIWSPFANDSLWREDFWSRDFYHDRWRRDFYDMDRVFRHMDSLRNNFLKEHIPDWEEQPKQQI